MIYEVIKTFKTTCGDMLEQQTKLEEFKDVGDYISFSFYDAYTAGYVYLSKEEVKNYLKAWFPCDDYDYY